MGIDSSGYFIADLPVRCHGDTRFEYIRMYRGTRGDPMHGQQWVPDGSFSADGFNLTFGRGMLRQNTAHDYMINFVWGIGRILPWTCTVDHGTWNGKDRICCATCNDVYRLNSHENALYDQIQYYTDRYIGSNFGSVSIPSNPSSLNYTMRMETGYYNYPMLVYGYNRFYSRFGGASGDVRNANGVTEGNYMQIGHCPHINVLGSDNRTRLILGTDYARAREQPKD